MADELKRAFHDHHQTDKDDDHIHHHIDSVSESGDQSDHHAADFALSEQEARDLLQKRRSERLAVMKAKETADRRRRSVGREI